jgi:hypothetical protein
LILSDTLQAHPFLSGPEDYCKSDNTLSIGPGYLLPKKKNPESGAYERFEYVSPPKDPAESLRQNKRDLVDLKDRRACLTKPAGTTTGSGTGGGTVGQSGISKSLDAVTGNDVLADIAKSLAKAERIIGEYCLLVAHNEPPDRELCDQISVIYPSKFELYSADELADTTVKFQNILSMVGNAPNCERELLQSIVRQMLLGLDDAEYEELDAELELLSETKSQLMEQHRELQGARMESHADALEGAGTDEAKGGDDPTGQSGGTMISNTIPAVV